MRHIIFGAAASGKPALENPRHISEVWRASAAQHNRCRSEQTADWTGYRTGTDDLEIPAHHRTRFTLPH